MQLSYVNKLLISIYCTISVLLVGSFSVFAVERYIEQYIDVPSFNLLPYDSIKRIIQEFGKTEMIYTPLAHNYMEYYDFEKNIELQFDIYQSSNSIWSISLRKTPLKGLSDNDFVPEGDAYGLQEKKTPKGITLGDRLKN